MRKLVLVFLVAFTTAAFAENYVMVNENFIEVTADAKKEVVPDKIYLKIVLNEGDYKNRTLADLENELALVLKKSGVDVEKSLKLKDLSSDFTKKFLRKKANVEQEYSLLLHDTKTLMSVIKNLDGAGFSDFNIERLEHSKIEEYKSEARIEAMKNAAKKASELAEAVGQKAGRAIYIYESGTSFSYPRNIMMSKHSMAESVHIQEESVMPILEFEPIKISATVQVRFEIK